MTTNRHDTMIFFDTGFFWKLAGKDTGKTFAAGIEAATEKHDELRADLTPPWRPWRPWRTAFVFMELIGLRHTKISKPPPFEVTEPATPATLVDAFNHCFAVISIATFADLGTIVEQQARTLHPCSSSRHRSRRRPTLKKLLLLPAAGQTAVLVREGFSTLLRLQARCLRYSVAKESLLKRRTDSDNFPAMHRD